MRRIYYNFYSPTYLKNFKSICIPEWPQLFESGAHVSDGGVGEEDGVGHGELEEVRAAQHQVRHVVVRQRVAAAGQVQLAERILGTLL